MIYEHTLANGLKLLAEERHDIPMVTVWSWYRVGSSYETPGITGITHLCEHMNFKESKSYPRPGDLDAALAGWGAMINGYTWIDTTTHYSVCLTGGLDDALKVEAERMYAMLYNTKSIETERGVVTSEYEGGHNDPEELLFEAMQLAAFQAHGYRWPTIGMLSDLRTFTAQQVRDHYNRYFAPNNAAIVVVGDFSWEKLKKKVKQHFGHIPPSRFEKPQLTAEPTQHGMRRVTVKGTGNVPYLGIMFHTPAAGAPDIASVLMLRGLLAGGGPLNIAHGSYGSTRHSSRLYKALVDTGLAARVSAFFTPTRDPFALFVFAVLHSEKQFSEAEEAVFDVTNSLAGKGPGGKELKQAASQFKLAFAKEEERLAGRAENMGYFGSIHTPKTWEKLKRAVVRQKADAVRNAAAAYGGRDNATVGHFIPQAEPAPPAAWEQMPEPKQVPESGSFAPRLPRVKTKQLPGCTLTARCSVAANGLTVYSALSKKQRTVSIRLVLPAGSSWQKSTGTVAELTGRSCVLETASYSRKRMLTQTDAMGTMIHCSVGRDAAILSATVLPEHLEKVLPLFFSVVSEPVLSSETLKEERKKLVNERKSLLEDPASVAHRTLMETLFPRHPYRFHPSGSEKDTAPKKQQVMRFWNECWRPEGSALVVAGNFKAKELEKALEKQTGWTGTSRRGTAADPQKAGKTERHVAMPGKTQSDIAMGMLLPGRLHDDYPALKVLDQVTGRIVGMGRLGARLRYEKGFAYYAYSTIRTWKLTSTWNVAIGVAPGNVKESIREAKQVLRHVQQNGVTEKECGIAKAAICSRLLAGLQGSAGTADLLAEIAVKELPVDYFQRYIDSIKAMKRKTINEIAGKYIDWSKINIVTAGPASDK